MTFFVRSMILTLLFASPLLATEHLSPHQREILRRPAAARPDLTFRFEAPAGPQFTDAQKQQQRERGQQVVPLVRAAFERGDAAVRIPPGDYRFGKEHWQGNRVIYPLEFADLHREPNRPFTIDATGATFWFDLGDEQLPPGHHCVGFRNCRNIVFEGATLDRGTRGHFEGHITCIDVANHRFEVEPSPGVTVPTSFNGEPEQRVVPFKADGRFCAPLYDLKPAVRHFRYKGLTPSTSGRYWLTMIDGELTKRIADPAWRQAYGDLGVLEVGDGLSCIHTTAQAISLVDSANLTMLGVRVHIAKGGANETGGEGGHLWKDCCFGPRSSTSQWQGGDGYMFNATRHGTTLDNVTIVHCTDDVANFHGYWGSVGGVAGRKVSFDRSDWRKMFWANVRIGDRARFLDRKTGKPLGEVHVTAVEPDAVTLDQDAAGFANALTEWPDHQCGGWVVQNCRWQDCFQRLLILSGPGTVRGCEFIRLGGAIELNTAMPKVGGVPSGITIVKNTFTDMSQRPGAALLSARGHTLAHEGSPAIERLVVEGNTFTRSGGPVIALSGVRDVRIVDNVFDTPLRATAIARPNDPVERQAIFVRLADDVVVTGNTLRDTGSHAQRDPVTRSALLGVKDSRNVTLDGRRLPH